jgi:DNA-binding NarL/FixJ family response regulator
MGFHVSENTRQTVIRLWMEGKSRKEIALITGVSEGTVSNIIAEWRQKLGDGDAEALRGIRNQYEENRNRCCSMRSRI